MRTLLLLLIRSGSSAAASGVDPAAVSARLAELAPLRAQRITTHAPEIPAEAWMKAATGEVVTGVAAMPGSRAKLGWGVAVLPVEIGRLWAGLNDELHHAELLGMRHIEIVRGQPCADRRQVMMVLPLPIVSDRWWVVENRYNTALSEQTGGRVRELVWTGLSDPASAPLSQAARAMTADAVAVTLNHGAWLLAALDGGHTLGEYFSWSDPGGELPAGPASAFATAAIADTMQKMADYAAAGSGSCR